MYGCPSLSPNDPLQSLVPVWLASLRDQLCAAFESIEADHNVVGGGPTPRFERMDWQRGGGAGGGVMSVMHGRVFEKIGVNVSTVWGEFTPDFRLHIPGAANDPRFWASGLSLVSHARNPNVPAAHFNLRMLATTETWFGGGGDLTPMRPSSLQARQDEDTFHTAFRTACDRHGDAYYRTFKAWCDRYFYLPHRQEPRGVGGIFFDHLRSGDPQRDFAFIQCIGEAFLDIYPRIVRNRQENGWNPSDRDHQLIRRSRYVEFNLLYDRGTLFGLRTGGNIHAILMSLPPLVAWP
jgi:coproporphyrinogen III oxidase